MNRIEVSTDVYLPPQEVYAFLLEFRTYAKYSEYLRSVRQFGEGGPGTEYDLEFAWWKLRYTARSRVVEVEPPNRIEWRVIKDIDAAGRWLIEPSETDETESGDDRATTVTLVIQYAPDSAERGSVDLPRFISFGWVIEKVKPKIQREAENIVRRVVADLEGEARDVTLHIETS